MKSTSQELIPLQPHTLLKWPRRPGRKQRGRGERYIMISKNVPRDKNPLLESSDELNNSHKDIEEKTANYIYINIKQTLI